MAWHRKLGFVEVPDYLNARLYLRAAEHELWRLEKLGQLDDARRAGLLVENDRWEREVARLEPLFYSVNEEDRDAASAVFRFALKGTAGALRA
jgi:hypothetical protein